MPSKLSVLAVIILTIVSCKSAPPPSQNWIGSLGPIAGILLAEEKTSVIAKLGHPTSKSSEKFPSAQYEVFEYSRDNGIPAGYVSLEPSSSKVAGRSVWISEGQPEQEFKYLQGKLFSRSEFETFVTCDKYHADEVKVDKKNGVFIRMYKGNVILVSWSDARLTQLRIDQFFLKCPERQKRGL